MIISGDRYDVQDIVKSMFEVKMVLTIRKFRKVDAGKLCRIYLSLYKYLYLF